MFSSAAPLAGTPATQFSRGINLSGGEYNPGRRPAVYARDYIYPSSQELDYYTRKGFTVVRLPYCWERLQPSLFGNLDQTELARITSVVHAAAERGMKIILSPHNFGRYIHNGTDTLIGTAGARSGLYRQ